MSRWGFRINTLYENYCFSKILLLNNLRHDSPKHYCGRVSHEGNLLLKIIPGENPADRLLHNFLMNYVIQTLREYLSCLAILLLQLLCSGGVFAQYPSLKLFRRKPLRDGGRMVRLEFILYHIRSFSNLFDLFFSNFASAFKSFILNYLNKSCTTKKQSCPVFMN